MVCDKMVYKTKDSVKKNIFWGILFINLFGILLHFLYDFSGKVLIVGIFAPINESIWEHLKLGFYPIIL